MMVREQPGSRWPPHLEVFDPKDWPPAAGELEQTCRCSSCQRQWGPPGLAAISVVDAHLRWRRARLETLVRGTLEFREVALEGLRENRILRDAERNPAKDKNGIR